MFDFYNSISAPLWSALLGIDYYTAYQVKVDEQGQHVCRALELVNYDHINWVG